MDIVLESVRKTFGDKTVIRNATFTVKADERVCFFGPSGCGKTTMLRLIAGLEKPDAGSILSVPHMRFACHFQEDRLLPWYTAEKNLALVAGEAAQVWLERIRLPEAGNLYPDELSGGMRRRVSLARALSYVSNALLLDEPLRELDAETATAMLHLIDEHVGTRSLILVTHDFAQAEALGCRIIHFPL